MAVPCGSLTNVLLDIFPQGHVTLFSLDVEGSEPLVLKQLDFEKVYIEVMIIENRNNFCNQNCRSRDEFRKIMDRAGYTRFVGDVTKSDLYIHPRPDKNGVSFSDDKSPRSWTWLHPPDRCFATASQKQARVQKPK